MTVSLTTRQRVELLLDTAKWIRVEFIGQATAEHLAEVEQEAMNLEWAAAILDRVYSAFESTIIPRGATTHPVDVLKEYGERIGYPPMSPEKEAQMRAICDEPVCVTCHRPFESSAQSITGEQP